MIDVSLPQAVMLVDATSGRVAGPFEPGSAFNADGLLSQHTNVWNGTPPVFRNRRGCMMVAAPGWQTTPPPGWTPTPATPGVPATLPAGRPTHWSDYECTPALGGRCRCVSTGSGTGTIGTPPAVTPISTRVVCTCSPDASGDCSPPGGRPGHPGTPPPATPPALLTNCQCEDQEWYY